METGLDEINSKSRNGGFVELWGMVIHWFSEMQTNVAKSSIESEYNGILSVSTMLVWMYNQKTSASLITCHQTKDVENHQVVFTFW